MGRPKGSVNKKKEIAAPVPGPVFIEEKGNPAFNLTDIEPSNTINAQSTITDEDFEIERRLEQARLDTPPIQDIDREPPPVTREKIIYTLLSEQIDVKPANTLRDLEEQVLLAKEHECDSIVATDVIVKHFCRKEFPPKCGFFFFRDIRVFQDGRVEEAIGLDKRTTRDFDVKGPISARSARPA